jgi:hypothetical protein
VGVKTESMFSEWEFDPYHVRHPTKGYSLWIANGLMFFGDDTGATGFLSGTSWWLRLRIWRELQRERRRRAQRQISELAA